MSCNVLQCFFYNIVFALSVKGIVAGLEETVNAISSLQLTIHVKTRHADTCSSVLDAENGELGGSLFVCHIIHLSG